MAKVRDKKIRHKGIIGFYKRKFFFFAVILILAFGGWNTIRNNLIGADTTKETFNASQGLTSYKIEVSQSGEISVNGDKISNRLNYLSNSDELRLLVIDNPGKYVGDVQIELKLPGGIAKSAKPEALAIHGVGDASIKTPDNNTIIYSVHSVSGMASVSIVAQIPKGVINPTLQDRAINLLNSFKNSFWIYLAIGLPIITFLVMLSFIFYMKRRQGYDVPEGELPNPPMAIPPAVVGVLFNQKVESREIAATLIDLALRGDLVILDQDRGFAFGKGRFDQRLLEYEKILLSKIFKDKLTSDKEEIETRINNHLYSKKMTQVASGIYSLATMLGYFKVNPQKTHAKYRFVGLGLFLLGITGFFLSMFYFTNPRYLVFFWVGMMVSAIIIIVLPTYFPVRTAIGQEVMSNWLAFRKYLSNPQKIPYSENNQQIFQQYLPYAIVMNCESAWAKRFSEHNFTMPEWFLTEKIGLSLEDFCLSLFPIVSYVGKSLVALKEPGFD